MCDNLRFYLITKYENGSECDSFIVESTIDGLSPYLNCYGDCAKYYEVLSEREVIEHVRKGVCLK